MLTELALTSERFARRISHLVLCDTTLPHYSFPSELSLKPLSLYLLWAASNSFFSTHLPTPLVHQYLSPGISPQDSLNYTVPYTTSKEKTGIVALAFMVPFSTFHNQYVYMWRNSAFGRLMEFVFPEFSRFLDSNYNLTLLGNKAKRKLAFKWDKPTLLMFGEDDQVMGSFKYPLSLTINRKAQQYSLSPIIISGAGHYPQEDEPQKFSEEILKFLKATEHEYRTVHNQLSKGSAVKEE
ncbi:hypothetical protein BKA69DRAFT_1062188 [Paraphysoderma sedebokerense]|nr:hypothetical protein BKA69DRAFT_1062188 [Paraphysoderma sedebokerense]